MLRVRGGRPLGAGLARRFTSTQYHKIDEPRLGNAYTEDEALNSFLSTTLPPSAGYQKKAGLEELGGKVITEVWPLAYECEKFPPTLTHQNAFGRRIDRVWTHPNWHTYLPSVSAKEGLVSMGYERGEFGHYARLLQSVKLYLFAPYSCVYNCPLAMTDGAARLLEVQFGEGAKEGDEEIQEVYRRLTTRDPTQFWTSGQWMTERAGGSDVSKTETTAAPNTGPSVFTDAPTDAESKPDRLVTGYKFFTSCVTADVAFGLSRPMEGKGLSVFMVYPRTKDKVPNSVVVHRLKEKYGTRAVPTAELELLDTPARLIGTEGRGVATIANMFNVTRIHNAIAAVGNMRRSVATARDYAHRRSVFGKPLADQVLQQAVLGRLEAETRACLGFTMETARIMGIAEHPDQMTEEERKNDPDAGLLLRFLTPLLKSYTGKACVQVISEAMECLGGQGYQEDSYIPMLLRDAQVYPIWEGTTNIQSLDVLRAIGTHPKIFTVFTQAVSRALSDPAVQQNKEATQLSEKVSTTFGEMTGTLTATFKTNPASLEIVARELLEGLSRTFAASILIRTAARSGAATDMAAAKEYASMSQLDRETRPLWLHRLMSGSNTEEIKRLALNLDIQNAPTGCGDGPGRISVA